MRDFVYFILFVYLFFIYVLLLIFYFLFFIYFVCVCVGGGEFAYQDSDIISTLSMNAVFVMKLCVMKKMTNDTPKR